MITATLAFTLPLLNDDNCDVGFDVANYYCGNGNTDLEAFTAAATNFYVGEFGDAHPAIMYFVESVLRYSWGDALTYSQNYLWIHVRQCLEHVTFQNTDASHVPSVPSVLQKASVPSVPSGPSVPSVPHLLIFSTPETRDTVTIGQR